MAHELWPHIADALRNLRTSIAQGVRRIVCQSPTGSGKTSLAGAIIEGATVKGKRTTFVVPSISLIDQTVERFYADGIRDVGVIQANHPMTDYSKAVQVASVQTLKERGFYPSSDIVMRDECHILYEFDRAWMEDDAWRNVPFIGLSATPWTKGMGRHYHSLLVIARIGELIEKGLLSRFVVYACPKADTSKVKIVTDKDGERDFHKGELSTVSCGSTLTADVIRTWKERWGKPKSLYFAVDRAHAETLHLRFQAAGVRSAYQDGDTCDGDRAYIERAFHNESVEVVVNIATLTTGTDWDVRCLGLCRDTKSEKLLVQIVGRGLRAKQGKDRLVMLDHTNTTENLGFVTDIHHERLDDGKGSHKREAEAALRARPLPRPCPECASLSPRAARKCPDCGFQFPVHSPVIERDGTLVEMVPGQVVKRARDREWSMDEKRSFFAQLLWYSRDRGYKDGWAANKYREKFGAWPNSMGFVQPIEPTYEVYSWIKGMQIRWIKGKQKADRMTGEAAE